MLSLLRSPVLLIAFAAVAGAAAGLWPLWQAGTQAIAAAVSAAAAKAEPVLARRAQGWDFWTIEIDNLASELKEERARLRKQAEQLDQRTARLSADQQELENLRTAIERMRRELGERVIEIKADESKNLRALAQTYTNLTPKAAVAIIRELDDTTVVKILSLMKPDVVAPIFEAMSTTADADGSLAKRAATLSEKLRLMKAAATGTACRRRWSRACTRNEGVVCETRRARGNAHEFHARAHACVKPTCDKNTQPISATHGVVRGLVSRRQQHIFTRTHPRTRTASCK